MMTINKIKDEEQKKQSELFKECGVFFAFSNEQFQENKTPLEEGEKYVSLGYGGYLPKHNLTKFNDGMDAITKWGKSQVKNNKLEYAQIAYELSNYECYYTGDISQVVELFSGTYTPKEIQDVYNKERKKHIND